MHPIDKNGARAPGAVAPEATPNDEAPELAGCGGSKGQKEEGRANSPAAMTGPEGGVLCAIVRHDAWCPGTHGDGANCICDPVVELVDHDTFIRVVGSTQNRAQRRAAARAAAKAARKGAR